MRKITVHVTGKPSFSHFMLTYGITDEGSLHIWNGEDYYVYKRDEWDGYSLEY